MSDVLLGLVMLGVVTWVWVSLILNGDKEYRDRAA